jgi:hypothetical protein
VADEKAEVTWFDLANYAFIAIMILRGTWLKE